MISRCSELIINWLIKNEAIKQEDSELYYYGAYSLIITILPVYVAISVGMIMGVVINSLVLLFPFMIIRKYSGGYHARNSGVCIFFSVTIIVFFTWCSCLDLWNSHFKILVLVSSFSLAVLSPIDSINKKLTLVEKRKYKKVTMCILWLLLLLIVLFEQLCMQQISTCVSLGIILSAGLQIPCLASNIWKKSQKKDKSVVSCQFN